MFLFGLSYIRLAVIAVAILGVGFVVWHYTSLKNQRDALLVENGKLEVKLEASEKSLKKAVERATDIKEALDANTKRINELADLQATAGTELRRINDVFAKHEFQDLLDAKPGLVIERINRGTERARRMLECASNGTCDDGGGAP